ncbi:glycosyltransferase family 25 protein [Ideonella livida]|uniref:Glycosyltransferase family 25 protein n=1 Tax=Ideonella livida TaxID=2707176 RepID=A0A7C9TMG5_9BURK|nr:glycosyltransferase family 25 protein [Ideonella livida]NDY93938.1 glycosyltransferase family 25 protein [Ideonella livida]
MTHDPLWCALFDQVWVLSLPGAQARREHIRQHLPAHGLTHFDFFDATPADAPEVARALASGEVLQFPPCFRCGGLDCGKPDCNNFLIPAQVACFLSYRRLWRTIAQGPAERVLVLEDDVFLHGHTPAVLRWLAAQVAQGALAWGPGPGQPPALLRLGWARGAEHEATDPAQFRLAATLRMANPCHALNRAYAQALVDRDRGICHTADVYQHQLAPQPGEALTVLPPIASELSWTEGRFASTIHPKPVHVQHLQAQGDTEAAAREAQRLATHVKKKHFRPLLISGHPRGGTGYAAALCRQLGLDVGHEKLGRDGISSWMFAVEAEDNPYAGDAVARSRRALAWQHLIQVVRDPATAAASVMRDSRYAPPSYAFRRAQILRHLRVDLDRLPNPLEQALWSVTSWARILQAQQPALVMRLEDGQEALRSFLQAQGLLPEAARDMALDTRPVNANKRYKGVVYDKPELTPADWQALSPATQAEVAWYAQTFGYALPWSAAAGQAQGAAAPQTVGALSEAAHVH